MSKKKSVAAKRPVERFAQYALEFTGWESDQNVEIDVLSEDKNTIFKKQFFGHKDKEGGGYEEIWKIGRYRVASYWIYEFTTSESGIYQSVFIDSNRFSGEVKIGGTAGLWNVEKKGKTVQKTELITGFEVVPKAELFRFLNEDEFAIDLKLIRPLW